MNMTGPPDTNLQKDSNKSGTATDEDTGESFIHKIAVGKCVLYKFLFEREFPDYLSQSVNTILSPENQS